MGASATTLDPNSQKANTTSVFLVTEKVIKANAKNVLRTIRQSFEWLRLTFESLKDVTGIGSLIKFTKTGEDTFAFGDFARSIMKICHSFTSFAKDGVKSISSVKGAVTQIISSFAENTLELVWNLFKVFKSLNTYDIFSLSSKIFIPLQVFGGSAFAISSTYRIYQQVEKGAELLNDINKNPIQDSKTRLKNEVTGFARVLQTAKNICTLFIGSLVTMAAINGFVAPAAVYLTLGTVILISEITSSILKESYHLSL